MRDLRTFAPLVVLLVLGDGMGSAARAAGDPADGTWQGIPLPGIYSKRAEHTTIYDPDAHRVVLFGGKNVNARYNDLWQFDTDADTAWTTLTAAGTPPPARSLHTAIYDPVRKRMIVYGGYDGAYPLNDTWALSLSGTPTWTPLAANGTPPPWRYGHTATYDSVRDRMLVIGGFDSGKYFGDVWELTLSGTPTWTQLSPGGPTFPARYGHTATLDPVRDRLIVIGGERDNVEQDLWQLQLSPSLEWSALAAPHPVFMTTTPSFHGAIYDAARDRILAFGSTAAAETTSKPPYPVPQACVSILHLDSSPRWEPYPFQDLWPHLRKRFGTAFDPAHGRVLITGGVKATGTGGNEGNDLWALAIADTLRWTPILEQPLYTGYPPPRGLVDPVRHRMLVLGAVDAGDRGWDVWSIALEGTPKWHRLAYRDSIPLTFGSSLIYDSSRDRLVVYGGGPNQGSIQDTTRVLSLSGDQGWTKPYPAGPSVPDCSGAAAIYDPIRDRMLVFVGACGSLRNDLWELNFSGVPQWTLLSPGGLPPRPRTDASAIYDPVGDRMILYGGRDASDVWLDELWALNLSPSPEWQLLQSSTSIPNPTDSRLVAYDSRRGRGLLSAYGRPIRGLMDLWALDFTPSPTWTELFPAGVVPGNRLGAVGYDASGDRLILYGKGVYDENQAPWELDFSPGTGTSAALVTGSLVSSDAVRLTWQLADAPDAPLAVTRDDGFRWPVDADAVRQVEFVDSTVVAGASYRYRLLEGERVLSDVPVVIPRGTAGSLGIQSVYPNPASAGFSIRFSLRTPEAAHLALVDVHGRVVGRRELPRLGGGDHVFYWGRETSLSPGVYMLRLTQQGASFTRRLVVAR